MYYHVDEPQGHYTNWNQPVTKGQKTKKKKQKQKQKKTKQKKTEVSCILYLLERGVKV